MTSNTSLKTSRWFCKFLWSQDSYVCLGNPAVYVKRKLRPDTLTTMLTYWTAFSFLYWKRSCGNVWCWTLVRIQPPVWLYQLAWKEPSILKTNEWVKMAARAKTADLVVLRAEELHSGYFSSFNPRTTDVQGEHKVFPRLQTFITRKLRRIQTYIYFFANT